MCCRQESIHADLMLAVVPHDYSLRTQMVGSVHVARPCRDLDLRDQTLIGACLLFSTCLENRV